MKLKRVTDQQAEEIGLALTRAKRWGFETFVAWYDARLVRRLRRRCASR